MTLLAILHDSPCHHLHPFPLAGQLHQEDPIKIAHNIQLLVTDLVDSTQHTVLLQVHGHCTEASGAIHMKVVRATTNTCHTNYLSNLYRADCHLTGHKDIHIHTCVPLSYRLVAWCRDDHKVGFYRASDCSS